MPHTEPKGHLSYIHHWSCLGGVNEEEEGEALHGDGEPPLIR
jgi:hypothetical protein